MPSVEDLEAQFKTAQAAVEAYSAEITAKYREQLPDPAEWSGPGPDPDMALERAKAWTEQENGELNRLRTVAREAAVVWHRARREAPGHTTGD